jgi:MHS family proline/betaine transporter-like MFS transporter
MKAQISKDKQRIAIIAGVIGNIIEWYDFALYGYLASIISLLFFPNESRVISLLSTYGIFAAGFIMRPIGSVVFGWMGDTIGRSRTMLLSVISMMIPTFALGLLPGYATIGILAPILLVILRLFQGLSVGGEFSSSVTYMVETAPASRRGTFGSWSNVGSGMGLIMGSLMATLSTNLLSDASLHAWGWRIPFLFGGILGVTAILLRRHLPKSPHFEAHAKSKKDSSPVKVVFRNNSREVLQGMLFASGYGAVFYLTMVYLPTWLNEYAGVGLDITMKYNTIATVMLTVLIPMMAYISDRFIRRTHFIAISMSIVAISAIPLFLWMQTGSITAAILVQLLFAVLISVMSGVTPAVFVELFPSNDRLSGYSISFNVGMGIIGGSTPMAVTFLIAKTGLSWFPGIYIFLGGLIALIAVLWMRDRSREPLRDSGNPDLEQGDSIRE